MFDELEDFLNASNSFPKHEFKNDSINSIDATSDLNDSISGIVSTKKPEQTKSESVKDEVKEKPSKFVAGKGQKMAMKRLDKLKEKMKRDLRDSLKLAEEKANKASPKPVIESPKKEAKKRRAPPTAGRRRRANGRRRVTYEDEDEIISSDDEVIQSRSNYQNDDPNTIVLDADDIFIGGPKVQISRNLNEVAACSTVENTEIQVSVRVNSKIDKYTMRPFQPLSELVSQIASRESMENDQIVLMFKNKIIALSETPDSIGYIQGLVIKTHLSNAIDKPKGITTDTNQIEIKIQSAQQKRPFVVKMGKTDKFNKIALQCAEQFKVDASKIRFDFDGDIINFNDTPDDLEFEGGEILDLLLA